MRVGGVAEHQRDFAGSRHVGSNRNGQAEGGPRRRCRSIQVEELAEAVPGIVRAGRPRSQEAFIHTKTGNIVYTVPPNVGATLVVARVVVAR